MDKLDMQKTAYLARLILMPLCLWLAALPPAHAQNIKTRALAEAMQISAEAAGGFSMPSDVAVSKQYIYVVDSGKHRVVAFDINGRYLFQFGGQGHKKGQLHYPVGIDVANGKVYVADSGNHRVQIFDASGKFLKAFPVRRKNKKIRPIDVLMDTGKQELYVTGSDNHRVMVFKPGGTLKRHWGGNGLAKGEFRYPATLAHMTDDRIAVVDVLNSRVQIFDRQGKFSLQVAGWGVLPGQVFRPKGVAVDKQGRVYISDSYLNLVQVFAETGRFLYVLGSKGTPYKLSTAVGMAIGNNRLYVTEMLGNKVRVFRLD